MGKHKSSWRKFLFVSMLMLFLLVGCSKSQLNETTPTENSYKVYNTLTAIPTKNVIPTETFQTPSPTSVSTISKPGAQQGLVCEKPSDNYDLLDINGHQLNQRTYEMLVTAEDLYAGVIDITEDAITQGSYTNAVEASFGTHAGGGAVDLSVMAPGTYTILYEDVEPLIRALRLAGFAAWYRDLNELYNGSPAHIHAIAIGDRTLSLTAREQLAGPFGYLWGYNGLPSENKIPTRDPHGGPIVCDWMIEKGYPNKTATPSADEQTP